VCLSGTHAGEQTSKEEKMKRILPVLLIVLVALLAVSCNQDNAAKLGGIMGKMSQNVYGIKPNMKAVNAASEAVTGTVEGTEVKLDAEKAAAIVDSITAVTAYAGRTEALKEELSGPIDKSVDQAELKASIQAVATASKVSDAKIAEMTNENQKALAQSVNAALDAINAGLSPEPTKAELATVAIFRTLAENVAKEEVDPQAGINALAALKVVSEFAGLNVAEGIDFSALTGGQSTGSRDMTESAGNFIGMMGDKFGALVKMISDNEKKEFNPQKYAKVITEARAIRASYESIALYYIPDPTSQTVLDDMEGMLKDGIDHGLTVDDFFAYVLSTLITELEAGSGEWKGVLSEYVNENYDVLIDLKNHEVPEPSDKFNEVFDGIFENLVKDNDGEWTAHIKEWHTLGTMCIILEDAEWLNTLLDLAGASSFSDFIHGLE